jgi:hypothetical protein
MGVSGQRHVSPALYPRGKDPGTHCTGGWVGPRAGLDTETRWKILWPLSEIEPPSSGRPVRNQTLYWMNYQDSTPELTGIIIPIYPSDILAPLQVSAPGSCPAGLLLIPALAWEPLNGFSLNLVVGSKIRICRHISVLLEVAQQWRSRRMKTYIRLLMQLLNLQLKWYTSPKWFQGPCEPCTVSARKGCIEWFFSLYCVNFTCIKPDYLYNNVKVKRYKTIILPVCMSVKLGFSH